MKKHDANSRGHSNGRSNGQSHRKPPYSSNNRYQNKKMDAKNAQIWVSSNNSKTLTTHLPGLNKGIDGNNSWKAKNSNTLSNSETQVKNRGKQEWSKSSNRSGQFRQGKPYSAKNNYRRNYKSRQEVGNKNESKDNSSSIQTKTSGQATTPEKIDPFNLFCAYHLGIGPNNSYKPSNINQVAQRFGVEPGIIRQTTKEYGFDSESMLNREFDLGLAQLDIQVAPEGISKIELAKGIYEEFCNAPKVKRNWEKILEEDKKENARVFGS